jgi:DNA-binding GntR family transcriptional regulator
MDTPPTSIAQYIHTARDVDTQLHDLIASSCDNVFLANELSRLKILFRVFRDVSWELEEARNDSHRVAQEAVEHLAIVDALLAGNTREAAKAMARHIRSGARYWSRTISSSKIDPEVKSTISQPPKKSRKS